MKEANLRILGVMTGTSCDGLDAACIEIYRDGWESGWSASVRYPPALRRRVLRAQLPGSEHATRALLELHRDLGEWYGRALAGILGKHASGLPDVIANHGQTIAHFPDAGRAGTTLQLGDPTRVSRATGLTVVARFREGDMSAGGQGAPLAPIFHQVLAAHLDPGGCGIAIHNIGGISNLTYIPPAGQSGAPGAILAFDTGPGNIWIDAAAAAATRGKSSYDRDGRLGSLGEPDWGAVKSVLKGAFFRKAPPKSTGRDEFPFELLTKSTRSRGADLVATATAIAIESMARAYERWIVGRGLPLGKILVAGGGAKNRTLMAAFAERLDPLQVTSLSEAGFDGQLLEAQASAYLAFLSLIGRPLGGGWTGAKGFGPPGQIVPGENWAQVVDKLRSFM